jgi:hypothetical protein
MIEYWSLYSKKLIRNKKGVSKMRVTTILLAGLLLIACLPGCGKKSALEGKVVDGKDQPMAGVRVVAKQLQTGKGQFESTTGADGTFRFVKLVPATEYELIPYLDANIKSRSLKTMSALEGQTKILTNFLPLLFVPSKDGLLVRDTSSGLVWIRDAGKGGTIDWQAAINMSKQFSYAGFSDWRLPTRNELRSIAAYGGEIPADTLNNDAFTNVQAGCYWSSNDEGSNFNAWAVNMVDGKSVNNMKSTKSYHTWLVRSGK